MNTKCDLVLLNQHHYLTSQIVFWLNSPRDTIQAFLKQWRLLASKISQIPNSHNFGMDFVVRCLHMTIHVYMSGHWEVQGLMVKSMEIQHSWSVGLGHERQLPVIFCKHTLGPQSTQCFPNLFRCPKSVTQKVLRPVDQPTLKEDQYMQPL